MKPYYEDELVTLYHADCREGFADYADEEVDLIVTDPPYTCLLYTSPSPRDS